MVNFFRSLFNCKKKNNHAVHPETNHPNQETDEVIIIKKARLIDRILLNRWLRILVVLALVAVVSPILIYLLTQKLEANSFEGTCDVNVDYQSQCLMGVEDYSESSCLTVGCCWDSLESQCFHRIRSTYGYWINDWDDTQANNVDLPDTPIELSCKNQFSPFNKETIQKLQFYLTFFDKNHLRIQIGESKSLNRIKSKIKAEDSDYNITLFGPVFSLEISRKGDESYILSTAMGPVIASQNFWEITLHTPSEFVAYGLGGSRIESSTRVMYNRESEMNTLPIIIYLDEYGKTHGLFIQSPGPMEVQFLQNSNLLILRSLSNPTLWDLHLFAGPDPSSVMNQLTQYIGKPKLPEFWALGLHICRDYNQSIEVLEEFSDFSENAKMYDSYCIDDSIMNDLTMSLNETYLIQLQEVSKKIHEDSRKLLLTFPLQINVTSDIYSGDIEYFLKKADKDEPFIGEYKNHRVVYIDLKHSNVSALFFNKIKVLNEYLLLDGFYLPDNWPYNDEDELNDVLPFVYIPKALSGSLSLSTINWNISHGDAKHYNIHNLYANLHIEALNQATPNKTLISNSGYPGVGQFAGLATGRKRSFPESEFFYAMLDGLEAVIGSGLAGIPFAGGSPICGQVLDLNTDLVIECARWYGLAAITSPLMRVSSPKPFRDPGAASFLKQKHEQMIVDEAIILRYSLLTYFYGYLAKASLTGVPLVKPLFYEFSTDFNATVTSDQVLIGDAFMFAPALAPQQTTRELYLPEGNWYLWSTGNLQGTGPLQIHIQYYINELILLMRGGYIVPIQEVGKSAEDTQWLPINLVAGLKCQSNKSDCSANGSIYQKYEENQMWINVSATESFLQVTNLNQLCQMKKHIAIMQSIKILGISLTEIPKIVTISPPQNDTVKCKIEYNTNVLKIAELNYNWCERNSDEIIVEWK